MIDKIKRHIEFLMMTALLLVGGVANGAGYKITYHILALPMNHATGTANTNAAYDGWRTEAVKVVVDNVSSIQLEAHFKSPLAKNFTYYPSSVITKDNTPRQIYAYRYNNKYILYKAPLAPYIKVTKDGATVTEAISDSTTWKGAGADYKKTATSVADMETQVAALGDGDYYFSFQAVTITEGTPIPSNDYHVYITYEYDADNTVAKLDGSEAYNILINGSFLAYNRGRNNRVALVPKDNIKEEQWLVSEDFMYVDVSKVNTLKDKTYWKNDLNKNDEKVTKSNFHFLFKYLGEDPYNITICSAYDKDIYYIEEYGSETQFVKKLYRNSSLFAKTTDEMIIGSDENKKYTQTDWSNPSSPVTSITSDATYDYRGYYHGILQKEVVWNSFAILNAVNGSGDIVADKVVYMATRTTSGSGGNLNVPSYPNFYYLGSDNPATVKIRSYAKSSAPNVDKNMYEARTFRFKIKTPFGNIVMDSIKVSEYYQSKDIDVTDIPESLERKYCTFNNRFFRDEALTEEIEKYSDLTEAPYDIYVGYTVEGMPFNALKPTDSYTTATWYELTDAGSVQANGKKLKYDGSANFKNNGAAEVYEKTSEFAFVGDPYELRVLSRDTTEKAAANRYVGGSANLDVNDAAGENYRWEIPQDDGGNSSFLLRKLNGEGYWYWDANHLRDSLSYDTKAHAYSVTNGNAQTITLIIKDLPYVNGHYITVTAGGTNDEQVTSTTPTLSTGHGAVRSDGTATVTVNIAASGGSAKSFKLTIKEYNSSNEHLGTDMDISVTQAAATYSGNIVTYSTENATRIKVMELQQRDYTYHIVDLAGHVAAKATTRQTIFSPLSVYSIPSVILSPLILDETMTFYTAYSGGGRGNLSSSITQLPLGDPSSSTNIYVKYTTSKLGNKPAKLNESQQFNVKLNGVYIYYDADEDTLKTIAEPPVEDLKLSKYLWKLRNRDPYAMLVDNMGAREVLPDVDHKVAGQMETVTIYDDDGGTTTDSRQMGAWITLAGSLANGVNLSFDTDRSKAQRFIAKGGTESGTYEVMVATDAVDASSVYYNIGCHETDSVKIFSNATYAHGAEELKFILNQDISFTYHLIDKAKHQLLTVESKRPDLILPAQYQSPLVGTYNYYARDQINIDASKDPEEYSPIDSDDKLASLADLYALFTHKDTTAAGEDGPLRSASDVESMESDARLLTNPGVYYYQINTSYKKVTVTRGYRGNHIYVTYEKNYLVTFNSTSSPYMLKFLDPNIGGYYLEDGNDKLTSGKIQAVYPYCNGDGCLNIYGTAMNEEQMAGGASTRPRWIWFFQSANDDPYHVKIHSKSTINYTLNNQTVAHPTYLQTYAVHYKQDAEATDYHIITGGVLAGIASINPTEYMVLGTEGHYKLLTTDPVPVDLNGDGDTNDEGESAGSRQYVQSFEQYWKTYNMIKQCLLEIDLKYDPLYKDSFYNDESKWVVPEELRATLNTKLEERGVGSGNWHSYDIVANAVRWNGYNDKGKANSKLVEKLEHWFQTFSVGDGEFDIESADIPPVLVLLDRHGWEIMRKPLGYNSSAALDVLRSYDSPMVKEYKFYSQATKATGCHKYTLRMQNGAERDQIKVNGKHYTSTSLADLPPESASGVKSNGAFNDQFVTYTVKEEYENSYQYHLELHEEDNTFEEWGTPSKFLVLTHGRFYRDNGEAPKPNYLSKPIRQGSAVPNDNGEIYDMILTPTSTYADTDRDGYVDDNNLWYVGPNLNIDEEMGIKWAAAAGGSSEPMTEYETKKTYAEKTGFDPYNIQFQHVSDDKFLTTYMDTTRLDNGSMVAHYTDAGANKVVLGGLFTDYDPSDDKGSEGYDHTNLQISNQTFMAVSDENGNMQFMPRFDHTKRITVDDAAPYYTTLEEPVNHSVASVDNYRSMGPQTSFLVRPQIFEYHIIDNEGNESLRYKTCGEYIPSITDHFRSPLASDFKYYFGYAVNTTSASNEESYSAAATPEYFKKEAASIGAMETAAKALTVLDDYYFKVGESAPFTYKKVTVTKAHSGTKDATYTVTDCKEADWKYAVADQNTSTDEADFESDIKALSDTGFHYFRVGPTTLYRKVNVSGSTKTAEDCSSSDWSSHSGSTVANMSAYKAAVAALSANGTYYYKINEYYSYRKVITKGANNSFSAAVAANADISDREITGTFAEVGLNDMINQVYVRYSYDPSSDVDEILRGKWLTIQLGGKDVLAAGSLITTDDPETAGDEQGTGVLLYTDTKPGTIDGTAEKRKWQWKFLASPVDPSSEYFGTLDPYAIRIFNRDKNSDPYLLAENSPMGVNIKVDSCGRFALLSSSGGYALAVAREDDSYTYYFLNGAGMTDSVNGGETPIAADTILEAGFTVTKGIISAGSVLTVNDDVDYNYIYKVITNNDTVNEVNVGNKLAVSATQDKDGASEHNFTPYLPFDIQSPLLNANEDYQYYGFAAESGGVYTVVPATKLVTLYGLYNDEVFVRYDAYNMDKGTYEVPNKKALVGSKVAKDVDSKDAALNIEGGLPYNIIWGNDNMMRSNDNSDTDVTGDTIKGKAGQDLQADGANGYVWRFQGNDPYALKIYNGKQGKYIHAASAANDAECLLTSEPTKFMLLKRENYDYGVLEMTGHKGSKLTMTDDDGSTLGVAKITTENPKYFIIFGLSTHRLIYHLMIAKTCPDKDHPKAGEYIKIPYRTEKGGDLDSLTIFGTTQRDLSNDTYQLGSTIFGQSYSYDAGEVSIGDVLQVPDTFNRPNCIFFFYVDNIQNSGDAATYQKEANDNEEYEEARDTLASIGYYYFKIKIGTSTFTYKRVHVTATSPSLVYTEVDCTADDWSNVWQDNDELNNQYKGLEITKLMSEAGLIGGLVKINIGYAFQTGLETNAGEGFVTSLDQNLWYTYEAKHEDGTPYLAHYTNAWGLQCMAGRATRYTNDYLWSPLGDVYGFKMYNRYMLKNSGGVRNVMTMKSPLSENDTLLLAVPGTGSYTEGNEVYELLASNTPGYFRIHPVINHTGTRYYIRKDPTDNYAKLSSTSYSEWTFNLNPELLAPYIERVNYVGGLKESSYLANKTVLDNVLNGTATYADMLEVQGIVYNDDNIVSYEPGYYRLHNQPGVSGISPVRYASGYLHDIEKTAVSGGIPLHFYSKEGVSTTYGDAGLRYGYTQTAATQGDIPIDPTEEDPSTIFYFSGDGITDAFGNPKSTMQTQGLYVAANANGDLEIGRTTNRLQKAVMSTNISDTITFSLMDIGGAVLLIHGGEAPATRRYLTFDQSNTFQKTATDDADMAAQAVKFTSKGTYYFKIGGSTYKKLTVNTVYVADPLTNATYDAPVASDEEEWNKAADNYDLKFYHDSPTDDAKWCMKPVQKTATADKGEMPLIVTTNNGGDGYYYSSFCAPFDVLLPNDKGDSTYNAYICKKWYYEGVNPTPVPAEGLYPAGKFIPAGTPVIIRVKDNSGSVQLTLPNDEPSDPYDCVFTGSYLEKLLPVDAAHDVYSFGLPFTSAISKDADYYATGDINASVPEKANTGVGFYINANPYKENSPNQSLWLRNNRYVLHNKVYYREGSHGAHAQAKNNDVQYVPIVFGDIDEEEPDEEQQGDSNQTRVGDGCAYDILGRKVASAAAVEDGTWYQGLAPGVYIVDGQKIYLGF